LRVCKMLLWIADSRSGGRRRCHARSRAPSVAARAHPVRSRASRGA